MPEGLMLKNYIAETKAVEGKRVLHVTITTDTMDRDGDIVEPKGIKLANYRKNNVVLLAHDYRGLPIAKGENLKRNEHGIDADVEFPDEGIYPLADTVYQMGDGGFIKAWSIGFIPIKTEDITDEDEKGKDSENIRRRGKRIKSCELLEFSACAVGCNPDALTNMVAKGINIEPLKEAGFIEIEEEAIDKKVAELEKEAEEEDGGILLHLDEAKKIAKEILEKELILKPEETDDSIRLPVKGEEGKHKGHKIRWITVSDKEGIRGIYCIDCKKIITFVFDKKPPHNWTMERAKKWMADHGKTIEDYFQKVDWDVEYEVEDIDYEELEKDIFTEDEEDELKDIGLFDIKELAEIVNRNKELIKENKELKEKIKELELKAGAVLNAKNKKDLKDAQVLIQQVLDSAGNGEEDSLEIDDEKDIEDDNTVIDLTTDTVDNVVINEPEDEDKIEVDEKVIADCITKQMNYTLGKLNKSDT